MPMKFLLRAGISLAAFGCAAAAQAEDLNDNIDNIIVTGQRLSADTVSSVEDARLAVSRAPGGVDVVGADAYADGFAINFRDMLAYSPGVFAQQRFGEEVRISIRGSGLSRGYHMRGLTLLQDGVPISLADSSADFQELDPLVFQHLEVYRGANGLRYGASTLGGAINAVTPSGRTAPYRNMLRLEGGSYGTVRAHAAIARDLGDQDVFAAVTALASGGYREHMDQSALRFTGNWGWRPTEKMETRFYLSANELNQELPSTLTQAQAFETPKLSSDLYKANDYARDIRSLRLSNKTAFLLSNAARLEIGGFLNLKDLYHPIFQVLDYQSTDFGGFARLEGGGDIGGMTLEYAAGGNLRFGSTDAKRYLNLGGKRGALTADADQDAHTIDGYGELRLYPVSDLALIGGLQFLSGRREVTDQLRPAASDAVNYTEWSPKIGLLWAPDENLQVFANLSRSAELPTFSEVVQFPVVGFVPVRAQTAWTFEAGTRGSQGVLHWDAAFYRAKIDGELLEYTIDSSIPAAVFNAEDTVHQGIELGLEIDLTDRLAWRQVYNWSDFHFEDDAQYADNRLPVAPQHYLRAELQYKDPVGFSLTPRIEWAPQAVTVDYANRTRAPGYALFGFSVKAELMEGWEIFVDARNLTDKKAISNFTAVKQADANSAVYYPVEGRSCFAGLRFSF